MKLGFYSEIARESVVNARQYIAKRGYRANVTDIRLCRQDMMTEKNKDQFGNIFSCKDFFGMSECRDFLFHVQEQRYTIPQIKETLKVLGLKFIGFSFEKNTANQYLEQYPDDITMTNLDNWNLFEMKYPNTFLGMYQFWTQKI